MAKKAVILLADGFEEIEAVTCIDILRRAGIEVTIASISDTQVKGSRRLIVPAEKNIDEITAENFDACILPGGMPGAANLAACEKTKNLIKGMASQKKLIAAICASPTVVLAPLGILDNKTATCYPGMQADFSPTTIYKEENVIADSNIITSRGPATALTFALKIAEYLAGKEISEKVKEAVLAE